MYKHRIEGLRVHRLPKAAITCIKRQIGRDMCTVLHRVAIHPGNVGGRILRPDSGGGAGDGRAGSKLGLGGAASENRKFVVSESDVQKSENIKRVIKRGTRRRGNVTVRAMFPIAAYE